MLGRVVKGIGGFYYVDDGKRVHMGNARKNLKRGKSIIYVGDIVEFDLRQEDGDCIITKGRERKFFLPVRHVPSIHHTLLKHPN